MIDEVTSRRHLSSIINHQSSIISRRDFPRSSVRVLLRVELAILGAALFYRTPPHLIVDVPAHGPLQRLIEVGVAAESDFLQLPGVEGVAAVVTLPVGDALDQ